MSHKLSLFKSRAALFYTLMGILLLLTACGGLAGEPLIVATIPPATVIADVGVPVSSPDIAAGAQIFAAQCTRCHGTNGKGDGQFVLSGQIATPPHDFTDPATAQDQSPTEWFTTITNGRLDNFMPPWKDALSEIERWQVALYTYTLNYKADQIDQGKALWETNCAECHGVTGAGDGPKASQLSKPVANLTQPEALIALSDTALFDLITQGKGDAMPAFADKLDETQRWQVTQYLRTLSLANAGTIGQTVTVAEPAATQEVEVAAAASVQGNVSGKISNGTQGGTLSADLPVILYIVDNQFNQETLETTAASDGTYNFADVPIQSDRAYVVTTTYDNHIFGSSMITGDPTKPALDMPITVYDTTDDSSVISVSDLITEISASATSLQVTQIMNFHNTSDRAFSKSQSSDGNHFTSLVITLPAGATYQSSSDNSQSYLLSSDGRTLLDTRPVLPNEDHIVHISYTLPFNGSADIQLPMDYAFDGAIQMLLAPETLNITSSQLTALGQQNMGGTTYNGYSATLTLAAGSSLNYSISGAQTTSAESGSPFSGNILAYVFIGLGSVAILGAAALYFYDRRFPARSTNNQEIIDMLVEQIANLDDLNQKKQIDAKAYQQQRARLKERLAKLMNKK